MLGDLEKIGFAFSVISLIGREGFNFFKDSWLDSEMEGGEEAVRLGAFKDRELGFSLIDSEEVFWGLLWEIEGWITLFGISVLSEMGSAGLVVEDGGGRESDWVFGSGH